MGYHLGCRERVRSSATSRASLFLSHTPDSPSFPDFPKNPHLPVFTAPTVKTLKLSSTPPVFLYPPYMPHVLPPKPFSLYSHKTLISDLFVYISYSMLSHDTCPQYSTMILTYETSSQTFPKILTHDSRPQYFHTRPTYETRTYRLFTPLPFTTGNTLPYPN